MVCPQCGTRVNPLAALCSKCGTRITTTALAAPAMTRPVAVTVLAVLQFIGAGFSGLVGAALVLVSVSAPPDADANPAAAIGAAFFIAVAAYQITCGLGLWRLRSYGRTMQMIAAAIGLLGIPVGTIISIIILVYLSKPGIKLLFSGRKPEELTPEEIVAVQGVTSSGGGIVIVVIAVSLLLGVFVVGIVAAIAIPGLLRARIAGNEAVAIGALRAISSAEASYAAANGGYYDSQECLVSPANCLPDYRGNTFLAEVNRTKSGFQFELTGTPAPLPRDRGTSRTSLASFVVIATPVSPSTGTRMFCVDDSGVIRSQRAERAIPQSITACPSAWMAVE